MTSENRKCIDNALSLLEIIIESNNNVDCEHNRQLLKKAQEAILVEDETICLYTMTEEDVGDRIVYQTMCGHKVVLSDNKYCRCGKLIVTIK